MKLLAPLLLLCGKYRIIDNTLQAVTESDNHETLAAVASGGSSS